ncbi:helix-turn-helix domain-containing protein [Thalassospira aquimaris]|uniref:Helix-turn-helix transcriptional regulator n=1 Tax=Thalassospira aquimaris TaxID=3037796 RepID=A0ABT6GIN6_9PROT|nr:helix-turn-helix transcriptional regulator [Thalassospira sp. FZY0004]MDG4721742.1 helix-turn-helix transcriptional regulator [Thalassospira sp. FZY0004]
MSNDDNSTDMRGRNRGRTATGAPNPVDVYVGSRIRLRRTLLGMSQTALADALGLTFQQVQKYERGMNRAGASRLYDLSHALDVPVSFFFDDFEPEGGENTATMDREETDASRRTLELVRNFNALTPAHQSIVSGVAKDLASGLRGEA